MIIVYLQDNLHPLHSWALAVIKAPIMTHHKSLFAFV